MQLEPFSALLTVQSETFSALQIFLQNCKLSRLDTVKFHIVVKFVSVHSWNTAYKLIMYASLSFTCPGFCDYKLSFVIRMFLNFVTLDNSFSEFKQTKQVISRNIFIFWGKFIKCWGQVIANATISSFDELDYRFNQYAAKLKKGAK